jgi:hypothetical protein
VFNHEISLHLETETTTAGMISQTLSIIAITFLLEKKKKSETSVGVERFFCRRERFIGIPFICF